MRTPGKKKKGNGNMVNIGTGKKKGCISVMILPGHIQGEGRLSVQGEGKKGGKLVHDVTNSEEGVFFGGGGRALTSRYHKEK